jgi:hypothetical protein
MANAVAGGLAAVLDTHLTKEEPIAADTVLVEDTVHLPVVVTAHLPVVVTAHLPVVATAHQLVVVLETTATGEATVKHALTHVLNHHVMAALAATPVVEDKVLVVDTAAADLLFQTNEHP